MNASGNLLAMKNFFRFGVCFLFLALNHSQSFAGCLELAGWDRYLEISKNESFHYDQLDQLVSEAQEQKGKHFERIVKAVSRYCTGVTREQVRELILTGESEEQFCTVRRRDPVFGMSSARIHSMIRIKRAIIQECKKSLLVLEVL